METTTHQTHWCKNVNIQRFALYKNHIYQTLRVLSFQGYTNLASINYEKTSAY